MIVFGVTQVNVVELQIELTEAMRGCQIALLSLIDSCIKELKRGNRLVCAYCCIFSRSDMKVTLDNWQIV